VAHDGQRRRRIEATQLQELLARQQLPQHDAQRIDVGAGVGDLAARLLRGQIRRAPEDHAGDRVLLLEDAAGQAEVGQLHVAHVCQEDVGRRDVAVDQLEITVGVHVRQRARHLTHHVQGDVQRDALARAHAAVPDLAQVLALDQLHGDVELAADVAGVERRHQRRVRQAQHHLGLVEEAVGLGPIRLLGDHLLDHAQLLEAADLAARRQIDLAHPPLGQRLEEHVLSEPSGVAPGQGGLAYRVRAGRATGYRLRATGPDRSREREAVGGR
jgi:hypothetical protein